MNINNRPHVDVNTGVDFERARERLSAEAGRCFRRYRAVKADVTSSPQEIAQARDAYLDAQASSKAVVASG